MHRVAHFKPTIQKARTVVHPRVAVTKPTTKLNLFHKSTVQPKCSVTNLGVRPIKYLLNVRHNSTNGNKPNDSSSEPKPDEPKESTPETPPEETPSETENEFSDIPDVTIELIDFEEVESKFKYEPSLKLRWEGEIDWKDEGILKIRKTTFENEQDALNLVDKATELYNQHKSGTKISNDQIIDLNEQIINARHRVNVDIEYVMQFFNQKRSDFAQSEEYMMKLLTEEYETYISIKKKIEDTKRIDLEAGSEELDKYNQAKRDFVLLENTWKEMQEKKPGAINVAMDYDKEMKILFKEMKDKEETARKAQAAIELLEIVYSDNVGKKLPAQSLQSSGSSLTKRALGGGISFFLLLLGLFLLYDMTDDKRKARVKLLFNQSVWKDGEMYMKRNFDASLERSAASSPDVDPVVLGVNMIDGGGKTICLEHAIRNLLHVIRFSAQNSSDPEVLAESLKNALNIEASPKSFDELMTMLEDITAELQQDTGVFAMRSRAPKLAQSVEDYLHETDSYLLRDVVLKLFGHPKLQNTPILFIDDFRLDKGGVDLISSWLAKEHHLLRIYTLLSRVGLDTDLSPLSKHRTEVALLHFGDLPSYEVTGFINGLAGMLAERNNQERWELTSQQIDLVTQVVGTSPGMLRYFMEGLNDRIQQRGRFATEGIKRVPPQLTLLLELKDFIADKREEYEKMPLSTTERSVLGAIFKKQTPNIAPETHRQITKRFVELGILVRNLSTGRGEIANKTVEFSNNGTWDKLQKTLDADITKLRSQRARPQQRK